MLVKKTWNRILRLFADIIMITKAPLGKKSGFKVSFLFRKIFLAFLELMKFYLLNRCLSFLESLAVWEGN